VLNNKSIGQIIISMNLETFKDLVEGILEPSYEPLDRKNFADIEETELEVRELKPQCSVYVPENRYAFVNANENNPELVTSHLRDCVAVTIHSEDASYGMAHVNRNDNLESFFSKTKSQTVEQMLEELPGGKYEAHIIAKGRPSETAFYSVKNSLSSSSKVEEASNKVVIPDYPSSELNPERKGFRNPIRSSIEVGLSPAGEIFIPGSHPIADHNTEIETATQGPGISEDYIA
jgi:hypothetical protein